jgi:hypothetical protein
MSNELILNKSHNRNNPKVHPYNSNNLKGYHEPQVNNNLKGYVSNSNNLKGYVSNSNNLKGYVSNSNNLKGYVSNSNNFLGYVSNSNNFLGYHEPQVNSNLLTYSSNSNNNGKWQLVSIIECRVRDISNEFTIYSSVQGKKRTHYEHIIVTDLNCTHVKFKSKTPYLVRDKYTYVNNEYFILQSNDGDDCLMISGDKQKLKWKPLYLCKEQALEIVDKVLSGNITKLNTNLNSINFPNKKNQDWRFANNILYDKKTKNVISRDVGGLKYLRDYISKWKISKNEDQSVNFKITASNDYLTLETPQITSKNYNDYCDKNNYNNTPFIGNKGNKDNLVLRKKDSDIPVFALIIVHLEESENDNCPSIVLKYRMVYDYHTLSLTAAIDIVCSFLKYTNSLNYINPEKSAACCTIL